MNQVKLITKMYQKMTIVFLSKYETQKKIIKNLYNDSEIYKYCIRK